jgi:hypothetical protein
LTFTALSADGIYLCVNVGHRELVEPLPLSVILDVFQPVWSRGQSFHEIGHAHDEHSGFAVPLNPETVVVFNSPIHDSTEPASDSGSGDFAGHGPSFNTRPVDCRCQTSIRIESESEVKFKRYHAHSVRL